MITLPSKSEIRGDSYSCLTGNTGHSPGPQNDCVERGTKTRDRLEVKEIQTKGEEEE